VKTFPVFMIPYIVSKTFHFLKQNQPYHWKSCLSFLKILRKRNLKCLMCITHFFFVRNNYRFAKS